MNTEEFIELLKWRSEVDTHLKRLDGGYTRLSDKLEMNTDITHQTKVSVDLLLQNLGSFPEFMSEGQSTFRLVKKIVLIIKWTAFVIGIPIVLIYFLIYSFGHSGDTPSWAKALYHIWQNFDK
jgi:hypothetical protein